MTNYFFGGNLHLNVKLQMSVLTVFEIHVVDLHFMQNSCVLTISGFHCDAMAKLLIQNRHFTPVLIT